MGLLELLVATTLLAVGIVATFKCLGAMAGVQGRTLEEERLERLALQTYDRLVAEGTFTTGAEDGDYLDQNEPRYIWHAERSAVGTGNLDLLRVEVGLKSDRFIHAQKVQGLVCRPIAGGS